MKKIGVTTKQLTVIAITAALYAVITIATPMISYGEIQCRVSEILNLLAFINPIFAPGVVLGCFIANIFSGLGPLDMFVGTFATLCAVFCITKTKNLFVASLFPTIFCVFIGLEFAILSGAFTMLSFAIFSLQIMAGEFVAVTLIGYPIFRYITRDKKLMDILKNI